MEGVCRGGTAIARVAIEDRQGVGVRPRRISTSPYKHRKGGGDVQFWPKSALLSIPLIRQLLSRS